MEETTQNTKLPSAFSLFKPSMDGIKRNLGTFLAIVFIPLVLFALAGLAAGGFGAASNATGAETLGVGAGISLAIFVPIVIAVSLILAPAMTYLGLQSTRGKDVGTGEALRTGLKFVWRYLGYSIVFGLLIIGGFILLIVPGLIVIRRYLLAGYFLVDKDLSIGEAMKQSAELSKQYSGAVWGMIGVIVLINVLSIVPVLGQIASFVLSILYTFAPAVRYHEIVKAAGGKTAAVPAEPAGV
jgi:uncharacterized membrane protein